MFRTIISFFFPNEYYYFLFFHTLPTHFLALVHIWLVLLEETYCVGMASFCYFFRHFKPGVLLLFLRGKKLGSSFGVRSGCILDYIFIEISWLFKRVTGKPTNSLYTRATQNYKKKNKKKQTYKKLQYFQSYNLVNT